MTDPLAIAFTAGETGPWRIAACTPVTGPALPAAPRLAVTVAGAASGGVWTLIGTTSNTRYATRAETDALAARQQGLGRPAGRDLRRPHPHPQVRSLVGAGPGRTAEHF